MTRMHKFAGTIAGAWLVLAGMGTARAATVDVIVANGTSREITGIYYSATSTSKWGPDQLNGAVVAPGTSWALPTASCAQSTATVVVEDEAGCFTYQSIACSGSVTLTLTNATPRDCGR